MTSINDQHNLRRSTLLTLLGDKCQVCSSNTSLTIVPKDPEHQQPAEVTRVEWVLKLSQLAPKELTSHYVCLCTSCGSSYRAKGYDLKQVVPSQKKPSKGDKPARERHHARQETLLEKLGNQCNKCHTTDKLMIVSQVPDNTIRSELTTFQFSTMLTNLPETELKSNWQALCRSCANKFYRSKL